MATSGVVCVGRFRSCAATHVGTVRTRNEDNFVNRPDLGIWAVTDGAGGHQAGDVAARVVAEALSEVPGGLGAAELLAEVRLRIIHAHNSIRAEAARRGGHAVLATTVVAPWRTAPTMPACGPVISRAYLLRGGQAEQVSHDQPA
jgi:protein phosphatase/serine/threonine-protein phosphatase Stp1